MHTVAVYGHKRTATERLTKLKHLPTQPLGPKVYNTRHNGYTRLHFRHRPVARLLHHWMRLQRWFRVRGSTQRQCEPLSPIYLLVNHLFDTLVVSEGFELMILLFRVFELYHQL